jgi:regulator of sigma E protease
MGADKAGLMEGDRIVKVNGQEVPYFQNFSEIVRGNKSKTVELEVDREGRTMNMSAQVNEQGQLGFRAQSLLERNQLQYSFSEAIPIGTKRAFEVTILNIRGLGKIIRGEVGRKSVKSIIGITEYFGPIWDWRNFWFITGMLSMWLAFLNFLPIPALDGGHVMFLTYEIVSGRKPSDKFLETAQKIGMAFLLVLMVFLIGNDIINLF